ncbi:hypothetical protein Tco_0317041 [Tanacetum coccineum]
MGNKELSTIPEKESDEFISPVLRTLSNPRESEDSSGVITFPEDVKIYSNPLLEFDDEYISNDVNPLFDEVLENIETKDSYVSNLDEPTLLVTPLSDANMDDVFQPKRLEILLVKYKGLKTKQKRGKLARAMLLYQEVPSSNMQRVKSPHATLTYTWLPRGSTWHATWRPDPTLPITRPNPTHDSLVDWRSTTVDRWSGGGQRWSATVDRRIRGTVAIQVDWYEVSRSTRGSISLVDPAGDSLEAITPDLPIEEPDNSLSMGDEHLSTIPETESDELIKSSVEILVPIPRYELAYEVQRIENKAKTLCSSTLVRGTVAIPGCWIEASGRLTCLHMIGGSSCY